MEAEFWAVVSAMVTIVSLSTGLTLSIISAKIEAVMDRIETLEKRGRATDKRLGRLDKKVGRLEKKVGMLDKKVGTLDKKIDQRFEGLIGVMSVLFDSLDRRLTIVEGDLGLIKAYLFGLGRRSG